MVEYGIALSHTGRDPRDSKLARLMRKTAAKSVLCIVND